MKNLIGLAGASHFVPTLLVAMISFFFSLRISTLPHAIAVSITVLSGQLLVGWSNDFLDYHSDLREGREGKPLVNGAISITIITRAMLIDLSVLLLLTFASDIGVTAGLLHLLAVTSALLYNFRLKSTVISVIPYALSFGLLPLVIYKSSNLDTAGWMIIVGVLFGIGAHFANVLKDLELDAQSDLRGLPQILGERAARYIITLCMSVAGILLLVNSQNYLPLVLILSSALFFFRIEKKYLFPLVMIQSAIELVLLIAYSK